MAINASIESIDNMITRIRKAISDIQRISGGIRQGLGASSGTWNDDKAQEFANTMNNIAALTETPVSTLEAAIPKLEQLKQAIELYNSTGIGE